MSKARILGTSWADGIALSATSELLPVANLQTPLVRRRWKGPADAVQNITGDFGVTRSPTALYLENINLTADAQMTIELSDASDFSSVNYYAEFSKLTKDLAYKAAVHWFDGGIGSFEIVDAGGDQIVDSAGDVIVSAAATQASGRFFRLGIYDPTNPDGFVAIGRLKIGAYFDAPASQNLAAGLTLRYQERAQLSETRGGALRAEPLTPLRVIEAQWDWVHEDDAYGIDVVSFAEILEEIGIRDDLVFFGFPGQGDDMERRYTVLGRMTNNTGLKIHRILMEGGALTRRQSLGITITESL